jgi:hypothetical protein
MADFTCNTNYLTPTGFKITISRTDYPNLQFFAQQVQHPSMDIGVTEVGRPRLASLPFTGDAIQHASVNMDVILDEEMKVYEELYTWMERLVNEPHTLPTGDGTASYNDIRVSILNSNNNPIRTIQYVNAFPIMIGDITLAATSEEQFITFPASFRFDYFKFL